MKSYKEFEKSIELDEKSRYKKPKNAFPQSKKTYKSSALALKAGNALLDSLDDTSSGTVGVAMLVKKKKYIIVWLSNGGGSIDKTGGDFLDAGHSSTGVDNIEDYEEMGIEDWEQGSDYVLKWIQ